MTLSLVPPLQETRREYRYHRFYISLDDFHALLSKGDSITITVKNLNVVWGDILHLIVTSYGTPTGECCYRAVSRRYERGSTILLIPGTGRCEPGSHSPLKG